MGCSSSISGSFQGLTAYLIKPIKGWGFRINVLGHHLLKKSVKFKKKL